MNSIRIRATIWLVLLTLHVRNENYWNSIRINMFHTSSMGSKNSRNVSCTSVEILGPVHVMNIVDHNRISTSHSSLLF